MAEEIKVNKPRKRRKARTTRKATLRLKRTVIAEPEPEKVETQPVVEKTKPLFARLFKRQKHDILTAKQTVVQSKVKKVGGRRWWLAGVGLAILALSYFLMTLYSQDRSNIVVALGSILTLGGGGFSIYFGLKKRSVGVIFAPGGKVITKIANCLNIYPELLEFNIMLEKDLMGQPQRCHNDNQYYHVHKWNQETKKLEAFVLPDTQYRDPREFANNLNIPAHRRLAQRREASLAQKIAPFALVAGIGIVGFLFLIIE